MILDRGTYYLYRHIRLDKNEPFYIGIGKRENNKFHRHSTEYRRAYVKSRNKYWKSIVSQTDYTVEILLESDDKKFISEKEKEFIGLYGRKNNGTGILSNMTDGGDYNPTQINKAKKTNRKLNIKIHLINRPKYGTNPVRVFAYDKYNGNFVGEYNQIKEAGEKLGIAKTNVSLALKTRISIKGYVFSYIYIGERCNLRSFNIKKNLYIPVLKIDPKTLEVVKRYNSGVEAASDCGLKTSNLPTIIKRGTMSAGFYWKYDNGEKFKKQNRRKRFQSVSKICPITNRVVCTYNSIKGATEDSNFRCASSIRRVLDTSKILDGYLWRKI